MSNKTRKKQIENQTQQGRSMVEMLGVLAVIGVISLGGISGYRMAMNRYQANQIANEINLMRTDAKMKVARGVELLLGEPYDGDDGHLNFNANYGVAVKFEEIGTDTPGETEKGYSFTLSNIPEGVCKPLVALLDNMDDTADIKIGDKSYYDEQDNFCGETNEVMVAFSTKDISGASGEKECDEETCDGECTSDGRCVQCNESGKKHWNDEIQACAACGNSSHCTSSSKPACIEGVCSACTEDSQCDTEQNEHCSSSGSCVTCGSSASAAAWNETTRKCDTCKNVDPEKPNWTGSECVAECPEGTFLHSSQKRCVECLLDEHCQKDDGQHYWCNTSSSANYGTCKPCFKWDESTQHCQRGECESNEDCDSNKYCKSDNCSHTCSNSQMTEEDSCKKYECVSIGNPSEKKINGKTYYFDIGGNWWTAKRYCEALRDKKHKGSGKLVSLEELGCTTTTGTAGCASDGKLQKALYSTCKEGDDTCCTEGKLCCDEDSNCPAFSSAIWTSTPYNSESDNSCRVYFVQLYSDYVGTGDRGNYSAVVCAPETE